MSVHDPAVTLRPLAEACDRALNLRRSTTWDEFRNDWRRQLLAERPRGFGAAEYTRRGHGSSGIPCATRGGPPMGRPRPPGVVRPMDVERRDGCREHAWAAVVQPFSCTYPSELRWREAASLTFVNRLTHL